LALLASACVSPKARREAEKTGKTAAESAAALTPTPGVDVTEASLRGGEFSAIPDVAPIYFEYDSANLSDEALAALKSNAVYLREHKDLEVRVAGFCDARGTIEYNLALGQKRAKEVREYYIRMGVSGKSVATISYGKEQPVCSESTEEDRKAHV
jgi:peptidoglycan-associated lipoprotein